MDQVQFQSRSIPYRVAEVIASCVALTTVGVVATFVFGVIADRYFKIENIFANLVFHKVVPWISSHKIFVSLMTVATVATASLLGLRKDVREKFKLHSFWHGKHWGTDHYKKDGKEFFLYANDPYYPDPSSKDGSVKRFSADTSVTKSLDGKEYHPLRIRYKDITDFSRENYHLGLGLCTTRLTNLQNFILMPFYLGFRIAYAVARILPLIAYNASCLIIESITNKPIFEKGQVGLFDLIDPVISSISDIFRTTVYSICYVLASFYSLFDSFNGRKTIGDIEEAMNRNRPFNDNLFVFVHLTFLPNTSTLNFKKVFSIQEIRKGSTPVSGPMCMGKHWWVPKQHLSTLSPECSKEQRFLPKEILRSDAQMQQAGLC